MSLLEKLKLDTWYGIMLYLGVLLIAGALSLPNIACLDVRHFIGLGMGLVMVGVAYFIAEKSKSRIKPANAYTGPAALISWKEIKHNPVSVIVLLVGVGCVCLFGFLVIRDLV